MTEWHNFIQLWCFTFLVPLSTNWPVCARQHGVVTNSVLLAEMEKKERQAERLGQLFRRCQYAFKIHL